MACGNSVTSDYIKNLLVGKDFKSRYFDDVQANGLYGLDLFLDFYQNNVNRAGGETDLNATANFVLAIFVLPTNRLPLVMAVSPTTCNLVA